MVAKPNTWVEEDREEVVCAIVDGVVATMTFEELRKIAWDILYEENIHKNWPDLWDLAEDYAPDLYEQFLGPGNPA